MVMERRGRTNLLLTRMTSFTVPILACGMKVLFYYLFHYLCIWYTSSFVLLSTLRFIFVLLISLLAMAENMTWSSLSHPLGHLFANWSMSRYSCFITSAYTRLVLPVFCVFDSALTSCTRGVLPLRSTCPKLFMSTGRPWTRLLRLPWLEAMKSYLVRSGGMLMYPFLPPTTFFSASPFLILEASLLIYLMISKFRHKSFFNLKFLNVLADISAASRGQIKLIIIVFHMRDSTRTASSYQRCTRKSII